MNSSEPGFLESRVRRAWEGEPGPLLRLAGWLFAAGFDLRNLMYDSGLLAAHEASIPVVSVGGLTVGGSGKTPIASDIACRLHAGGLPTAIITYGHSDEMACHERLCPEASVYGGRDRRTLVERAARDGAGIVVLDSAFQHRRLRRDLDIVVVDALSLRLPARRLPAGPFREPLCSVVRADLIVFVDRDAPGEEAATDHQSSHLPHGAAALDACGRSLPPVVEARIVPGALVPLTSAASGVAEPRPRAAVAGIMWPETFFASLRGRPEGEGIELELGLSDHARIDEGVGLQLRSAGAEGGVVCTLKDASKLVRRLGDEVPVWYVSETVHWPGAQGPPAPVRAARALAALGREMTSGEW